MYSMSAFKILSCDGGGIRGALSARILDRLGLLDADLYAGSSSGGIIALGLAFGLHPSKLVDFYRDKGARVFFRESYFHRLIGGLFSSQYSNKGLKEVLQETFGDARLGDLQKKVLIPTFDLMSADRQSWKPKFFHNLDSSDLNERIVDVALRTSAAPSYFPSYQGYVDGGLVANNPSVCALAQALDEGTVGACIEDVRLLSISTGRVSDGILGDDINWGLMKWIRYLINLEMEGSVNVEHYQCSHLLKTNYFRLDPVLPQRITLDDVGSIDKLLEVADELALSDVTNWLEDRWYSDENIQLVANGTTNRIGLLL